MTFEWQKLKSLKTRKTKIPYNASQMCIFAFEQQSEFQIPYSNYIKNLIEKSGQPVIAPLSSESPDFLSNRAQSRPQSRPQPDVLTIGDVTAYDYSNPPQQYLLQQQQQQQQQLPQQQGSSSSSTSRSPSGSSSSSAAAAGSGASTSTSTRSGMWPMFSLHESI